jgi:TRAP-type C4-dicarboxylate transport system permease small subunit
MKILGRIDTAIARVEGWLLILFLTLMVFLTFLQVILRSLFVYAHMGWANDLMGSIDWVEPFVRLLVLWVTFLGASLVTGENKHIKIDLLTQLIPEEWRPSLNALLSLAGAVVTALMFKASLFYVQTEMSFGGVLFLQIPNWVGQLILPAGFLLICFRFVARALSSVLTIFGRTAS